MKYLRLSLISKEGLQRIYNEPLVRNNIDVMRGMLENIISYNSKPLYTLGRCAQIESSNIIFAITGDSNSAGSSVKYMDIRNDKMDDLIHSIFELQVRKSNISFYAQSLQTSRFMQSV
ncbi:uncharacterized protein LOC126845160 [Adelges cooleyi]|uniref:uncharacterized protein LOC126845160 n=1 Tax=Adelges cooleyi TaxID=133065 RepID=UPI00217F3A38|nr:uncharacterized protein LOC126845160 [Adelges cooleyi]